MNPNWVKDHKRLKFWARVELLVLSLIALGIMLLVLVMAAQDIYSYHWEAIDSVVARVVELVRIQG
jgi:hypothetical protein